MSNIITDVPRDTKIRRYMTLDKFESILECRELYFSRFDNFEDRLEGGISTKSYQSISNSPKLLDRAMQLFPSPDSSKNQETTGIDRKILDETFQSIFGEQSKVNGDAYLQHVNSWLYASCWTDLPHECQAMWQLYGSSGANCRHEVGCTECERTLGMSVCIETTLGAVLDNLELTEDYNLTIGKVEYLDHRNTVFEDQDLITKPFFSKALHFSYENEIRFMLWPTRKDIIFSYKHNESTTNEDYHISLPIKSMEGFLGKVILSPLPFKVQKKISKRQFENFKSDLGLPEALSNSTLRNMVNNLCNKHGISINVVDSDLNQVSTKDLYTFMDGQHGR
nr:hypothetical protein [uncultured Pseudomonas sp.]